jgi:hypothetical protein
MTLQPRLPGLPACRTLLCRPQKLKNDEPLLKAGSLAAWMSVKDRHNFNRCYVRLTESKFATIRSVMKDAFKIPLEVDCELLEPYDRIARLLGGANSAT